jgi:hypothetical protein
MIVDAPAMMAGFKSPPSARASAAAALAAGPACVPPPEKPAKEVCGGKQGCRGRLAQACSSKAGVKMCKACCLVFQAANAGSRCGASSHKPPLVPAEGPMQ